jgi:branched-chain amino acid transport system substrate-binding protein
MKTRKGRNVNAILIGLMVISLIFLKSQGLSYASDVKIGFLLPLTGSLAPIGKSCMQGANFAVDEINANGGIASLGGAKLKIIKGDTEGKPEIGMAEAERMSLKGVVAFVGSYQSAVTFATSQVAERKKIPWLTPISIADKITDRGFKYVFRLNNKGSEFIPRTLENFKNLIQAQGVKNRPIKMAMMFEDSLYGQSLNKDIKKLSESGELEKQFNFRLVGEVSYPHSTSDVSTEVTKLKYMKPDVLLTVSYVSDSILIIRTIKETKFNLMGIYITGGGFGDKQLIDSLGKDSEYVLGSEHWAPNKHRDLKDRYEKRYGMQFDGNSVKYYTGVYVLKEALERAKSVKGVKLRDALASTRFTEHVLPFDVIEFDQTGHNQNVYQVVAQIRDGKYQIVFPSKYSELSPVFPVPKWEERK